MFPMWLLRCAIFVPILWKPCIYCVARFRGNSGTPKSPGDNFPGRVTKNAVVQKLKKRSVREVAGRRAALVELVQSYGLALRFFNGGGTGSIATTRKESAVTEITVGSGFYAPALFDNYRDFRYQPAAG